MALKRLQREYMSLMKDPIPVGTVTCDSNDPFLWKARLIGPEDSPYQNAIIEVDLEFTEEYPIKPPNIKFKPGFFHANVASWGHLCIDLLKDWRPTDTVTTILLAINNLLSNPNRDNPYQWSILSDDKYLEEAKKWTKDNGML